MSAAAPPPPEDEPMISEPTSVITGQLQAPDGTLSPLVQFGTPYGPLSFRLPLPVAKALGEDLIAMAAAGNSNILIPNAPLRAVD